MGVHELFRFENIPSLIIMGLGLMLLNALIFRAAHYFVQLGRFRLRLPNWLSPGALAVTHAELGDGRFLFKLDIVHPRLGRLICQTAAFREAHP